MRTIKFRAWDGNKMIYSPSACDSMLGQTITLDGRAYSNGALLPWTLEQFTGLLDKNGKEIYEGDMVRETWNDGMDRKYIVGYSEKTSAFVRIGSYGFDEWPLSPEAEIIGNIHENPELLK